MLQRRKQLLQVMLECGLLLVIAEGFIRRALPTLSAVVMGIKLAYFPVLYIYAFGYRRLQFRQMIPSRTGVFLLWIMVVSIANVLYHPYTTCMGLAVFFLMMPTSVIARQVYPSESLLRGFCIRASVLCIGIGLLATVQTLLPPDHWLNLQLDFKTSSFGTETGGHRANGPFQYPTVYGNFCVGAMICSVIAATSDRNRMQKLGILAIAATFSGGYMSGSRAGLGAGAVFVLGVLFLPVLRRQLYAIGGLSIPLVLVCLMAISGKGTQSWYESLRHARVLNTEQLSSRVTQAYFGSNILAAAHYGGATGLGVGPNTHGVETALSPFGLYDYNGPEIVGIEGGYSNLFLASGPLGVALYILCVLGTARVSGSSRFELFLGCSVCLWGLLGNLPLLLFYVPALSGLWWVLAGAIWGIPRRSGTGKTGHKSWWIGHCGESMGVPAALCDFHGTCRKGTA